MSKKSVNRGNMSNGKLGAVLWDMDGVIADTGIYHCRAWQEVFGKRGVVFTEENFMHHFGQRNDTIIRSAMSNEISQEDLDLIAGEKEANYRKRISQNVKPLPGAVELIESLGRNGIKAAVASSAPMENIELILQGLGIKDSFQAIVYGREVTEGKPSPKVFLLAAEKLAAEPEICLVIEDAIAGVAAAKSAGMKCLAVTNSHPRDSLKQADLIVDSLEAVSIEILSGLF